MYNKLISFRENIEDDVVLTGMKGFVELVGETVHQPVPVFWPNADKVYLELVDECFPALSTQDKEIMVDIFLSIIRYTDLTTNPVNLSKKAKNIMLGMFTSFSIRDDKYLSEFGEEGLEVLES